MRKPNKIVMSMSPNMSYLEGYNSAIDSCEAYQNHLVDLLSQVMKKHCPVDCSDFMDPLLKQEVEKVLGETS